VVKKKAFSARRVQKHHKKRFGESPCQNLLTKESRGKKNWLYFFPLIVLSQKHHGHISQKIKLEISRNLKNGR
jgi:hypothetical protein